MRVDPAHVAILAASTINGNTLALPGELERKTYLAIAKALEAAGGAWNRRVGAHVFNGCAAAAIEPILLTGQITHARDEFDFFPTPPDIVARMLELVDIRPGDRVLEPSAGDGAIVRALAGLTDRVHAHEIQDANVKLLQRIDGVVEVGAGDFLARGPEPIFDAVVMNPPFSVTVDVDHVLHAARFLQPGGRLVSVMSAGVRFRTTAKHRAFRDFLDARVAHVEDLPDGSFLPATGVRTILVAFDAEGGP